MTPPVPPAPRDASSGNPAPRDPLPPPLDAGASASASPVLTPVFLRLLVGNFLFFMTFATFFLLPIYVHELGGDDQTVGWVMGISGASSLAGVLVVAALIDRVGARLFSRIGFAGLALVALAFGTIDHIGPELFALRIVQGLVFACGFNGNSTLAVTLAPPERRATALGFFGISTLTTHALAPAIGEQVAALVGFRMLFGIVAAFSALGLVLTWSLADPTPGHLDRRVAPLPVSTTLVTTIAATALCGVSFGSVMTFVPTFTMLAGLGPVATFFLSYTSAAIGTRFFAGSLADRVGHARVILPGMFGLALAIAALAAVESAWQLVAVGIWFGLAQGVVFPTLNAWTVGLGALEQIGRIQSIFNGAFNVGITLGALGFGPVVARFGHRPMFVAAGGASLAAAGLFAAACAAHVHDPAPLHAAGDEAPAAGPELGA